MDSGFAVLAETMIFKEFKMKKAITAAVLLHPILYKAAGLVYKALSTEICHIVFSQPRKMRSHTGLINCLIFLFN